MIDMSGGVVYADPSLSLDKDVVKLLNREAK